MNRFRKLAACITAATMATAGGIGFMPYNPVELPALTVSAAEIVDSGVCGDKGDNVIWELDSDGTLTISGEGAMKDLSAMFAFRWSDYDKDIKEVVIKDGVTAIGNRAFRYTSNLTKVTIADSVTSIGLEAFSKCHSLTSITIPDSVTNLSTSAFEDSNLTSITIPDSVTSFGSKVFKDTPWLEAKQKESPFVVVNEILIDASTCKGDVIIPDGVKTIGWDAFLYSNEITSVTIPNSVTDIEFMAFEYCNNLVSVTIPDSVTRIGKYAFQYCENLTSITLPESVAQIGYSAFWHCDSLESIIIKNPECEIDDSHMTFPDDATIYGYINSTAPSVVGNSLSFTKENGLRLNWQKLPGFATFDANKTYTFTTTIF